MSSTQKLTSHCNRCLKTTNHQLIHKYKNEDSELIDVIHPQEIWWEDTYELIECLGCNFVSLIHTHIFSEYRDENGNHCPDITQYPARISRSLPRWLARNDSLQFHVGKQQFITDFLREIYTCLDNNSARTASLTIRALLEHIMIDLVGDNGALSTNIKRLKNQGYVTDRDGTALEAVIEMGSASMHRGHKPKVEDLHTSLDIIENLIELVYLSESRGKKLEDKTPKRQLK